MQSSTPIVLIADPLAPEAEQELGGGVDIRRVAGTRRQDLLRAVRDADALIVRSATTVDSEVVDAAERLKIIGRAGVGVDNIDVEAATERGIIVANTPTANIHSACEHAVTLLLAAARAIPAANASTHAGGWERSRFQGAEIYGKTVGVVGFGRVGRLFAERIAAFGTHVLAYDPYPDLAAAEHLGVELVDLDTLVARADFVSIHVPKTPETQLLFDDRMLRSAKPGQILVNTSRGGVVDEQALAAVLQEGPIAAAGIDVFQHEPPQDSPLLGLDNVVLTPHLGAQTREAQARAGVDVARAVLCALRGEAVPGALPG